MHVATPLCFALLLAAVPLAHAAETVVDSSAFWPGDTVFGATTGQEDTLRITPTGELNSVGTTTTFGRDAGATGHGVIAGRWLAGNLVVGTEGVGTFAIGTGSRVDAQKFELGRGTGGNGTLEIAGAGAELHVSGTTHLRGAASVGSGGKAYSAGATVEAHPTHGGRLLIDGAGSRWEDSAEFSIGSAAAAGKVTLRNGGVLKANSLVIRHDSSLNIGAAAGDAAAAAGVVDAANIHTLSVDAKQKTVQFNHTATEADPYHFTRTGAAGAAAVQINGTRLAMLHTAGATVFTGSSSYTAGTRVTGGTVYVESSTGYALGHGEVRVESGGTLGGSGLIHGPTRIYGTLSPGRGSIGLLDFDGNLTLESTAHTMLEVASASSYDQISVNGLLTLNGTLHVTFLEGYAPELGERFTLLYDVRDYSGAFSNIVFSLSGYSGWINYNTGVLTIDAVPEPSLLVPLALALGGAVAWRRRATAPRGFRAA